jgi:hypothetical protein
VEHTIHKSTYGEDIMSIENTLDRIATALEKIAANGGNAAVAQAAAPAAEKPAPKKTEAKAEAKPKAEVKSAVSMEAMTAAVLEVKENFGMPEAKKILMDFAGVEKMAQVPTDKIEAVYNAAKSKVEGNNDDAGESDL